MNVVSLVASGWRFDPVLCAIAAGYVLAYVLAAGRLRRGWPLGRSLAFASGVGVVLVAFQSGLAGAEDQLLSVHMTEHMLLLLVAPALLVAGRPVLLALAALPPAPRRRVARGLAGARRLSGAPTCVAVFCAVVLLSHLPSFYQATLRHPLLHAAEHIVYLGAGCLLWWPILDGDPLPSRRLGGIGSLLYLLVSMVPMAVVGAILNRSSTLVYPAYGAPAHALGISALADQAQAGAIMWVGGDTVMIAIGLYAVLAALVAEERRLQKRELHAAMAGEAGGGRR